MDMRKELLSDIRSTLKLLERYSSKKNVDISSVIATTIDSAKDKNLIDLFVIREFVKDKSYSLLSAELDKEEDNLKEDTKDLDFNSEDLENSNSDPGPDPAKDLMEENEDEDKLSFEERKQELLDKAETYIQSIDLGITNIQNGDVNLELVGKLIDLKILIQDAKDKLNTEVKDDGDGESALNTLKSVLNSMDPDQEGNVALEDIIEEVSEGSVEADQKIYDLIDKINSTIENPETEPELDTGTEDLDEVGIDAESDLDSESDEPEISAADEFVEDVKEKEEGLASSDYSGFSFDSEPVVGEDLSDIDPEDPFAFSAEERDCVRKGPLFGEDLDSDNLDTDTEDSDTETTPYVKEVEDVDFGTDDIHDIAKNPDDDLEDDTKIEEFREDISNIKDSLSEKLGEIEEKYSLEDPIDNESLDSDTKDSLDSEDALLSTDIKEPEEENKGILASTILAIKKEKAKAGTNLKRSIKKNRKKSKLRRSHR